jgi:uncharacterized RDD family membrane protein YckC
VDVAGFWRRVAAKLVDSMICALLAGTAGFAAIRASKTLLTGSLVFLAAAAVGLWVYYAGFESSKWQATPGKRLFGLSVTDEQGRRIGLWRATRRFAAKGASGMLFNAGFLRGRVHQAPSGPP